MSESKERTISATELMRHFGATLDEVRRHGAVIVTEHGRPQVVMLTVEEYESLCEARRRLAERQQAGLGDPPTMRIQ